MYNNLHTTGIRARGKPDLNFCLLYSMTSSHRLACPLDSVSIVNASVNKIQISGKVENVENYTDINSSNLTSVIYNNGYQHPLNLIQFSINSKQNISTFNNNPSMFLLLISITLITLIDISIYILQLF